MRKTFFYIVFALLGFSFFIEVCDAKIIDVTKKFDNNVIINYQNETQTAVSCNGLFTSDALDLISELLNMIRIAAGFDCRMFDFALHSCPGKGDEAYSESFPAD